MTRSPIVSALILAIPFAARGQNPTATINVDAAAGRHAISPYVSGVAGGNAATLPDLN